MANFFLYSYVKCITHATFCVLCCLNKQCDIYGQYFKNWESYYRKVLSCGEYHKSFIILSTQLSLSIEAFLDRYAQTF